jgi:hypothetical protein
MATIVAVASTSRLERLFTATTWLPVVLAAAAGGLGYSGVDMWLAVAPLTVLAWGMSRSRWQAFAVSVVYYALAGRGLFHGGGVFFAGVESSLAQSLVWGGFVWLVPSIILGAVWGLCWSRRHLSIRLVACLVIISVPPVGQIGWASPIASAGILFPGLGWFGLSCVVALLIVLCEVGMILSNRGRSGLHLRLIASSAIALAVLSGVSNVSYRPTHRPDHWISVQTHVHNTDGYEALRIVQDALSEATKAGARVVVFPEAVGGDWGLNRLFLKGIESDLEDRGVTAIIGADRAIDQRLHVNALMTIGKEGGQEWPDRAPVPLGMWNPLSSNRHVVADWNGTGVRSIDGREAMYLICYEQLLIWPVLRSFLYRPTVIIGASNLWWANGTTIPGIQKATLNAWGRLFSVPVLLSVND